MDELSYHQEIVERLRKSAKAIASDMRLLIKDGYEVYVSFEVSGAMRNVTHEVRVSKTIRL